MLCVCRGEAVRLFHVWHEVFPALPPGETQTHSYGYASIYRTQFKLRNFILSGSLIEVKISYSREQKHNSLNNHINDIQANIQAQNNPLGVEEKSCSITFCIS